MTIYNSRNEVPEKEKWNFKKLYTSQGEWEDEYTMVEKLIEELNQFNGAIIDGKTLYQFLIKEEDCSYVYEHLYAYAMLLSDVDTRDTFAQSLEDRVSQLGTKLSTATSFFMPFLLSLDENTLKKYIEEEPRLKYFEKDLFDSYRFKHHILSKEQEEILSHFGEILAGPSTIYGMLDDADIKFGEVTNENGEKVELTRGMYSKLMEDKDRAKRKEAYEAHYKPYIQLKNTFAATLAASIKSNVTLSKLRHFPSALDEGLFGDKVPREVYENLIAATKANIHSLHRYTTLRKEKLNVEELHPYDLFVPLVDGIEVDISYDEAYETMLKALAPLGEEYVSTLKSFKDARYVDVRETPGKRSGAYNMGVYGVHPFILLNHQDDLDSLSTLAHECGHALHSHYSNANQPKITAGYSIFVAEVASTVNEVLLINYLINNEKDANMKKYLLNQWIDQFKGTFFTQVMFAEFEKITHEMAEAGEPLNEEVFSEIYESLFRQYHGEDLVISDELKYGYSRIPHFYSPFYVYQYATGYASAIHIADKILSGDKKALESYLNFLKSGSSEYPLELLKKTGVDLTTPEPIKNALSKFEQLVQELSTL